MAKMSDFTDEELAWLAKIEQRQGVVPPDEIKNKLVKSGVADITDLGLKITGHAKPILDDARINRRIS